MRLVFLEPIFICWQLFDCSFSSNVILSKNTSNSAIICRKIKFFSLNTPSRPKFFFAPFYRDQVWASFPPLLQRKVNIRRNCAEKTENLTKSHPRNPHKIPVQTNKAITEGKQGGGGKIHRDSKLRPSDLIGSSRQEKQRIAGRREICRFWETISAQICTDIKIVTPQPWKLWTFTTFLCGVKGGFVTTLARNVLCWRRFSGFVLPWPENSGKNLGNVDNGLRAQF